jgi:SAM-dependent methyltransferase
MSACLLCGSGRSTSLFTASDRLFETTREQFTVVRCVECGLVRLDPQPPAADLHRYYPAKYWFTPDTTTAGRLEEAYRRLVLSDHVRFVDQALRRTTARGPLLDVGSGGGLFLALLRKRGFRGIGLDFSAEAAALAWRGQGTPTVCALLERAPIRTASLSAVSMFHVLEHLPDPKAYLSIARDLLAPDGRLIVQVPNAASWQFRLLGKSWNGVDVPRHLFDFRDRDVEKLLAASGLQVLRRKYFSLRDNPAGLASSLAPGLDPMARRIRGTHESPAARLAKDLAYFGLAAAALPFTVAEAAFRAGSTVMIEARRP